MFIKKNNCLWSFRLDHPKCHSGFVLWIWVWSVLCGLDLKTSSELNIWRFMFLCFFAGRERTMEAVKGFDIDTPRWDQSTFMGRLKHFFNITDCRTALLPDSRLDEAKVLVESCRLANRLIQWAEHLDYIPVSYFCLVFFALSTRAGSVPPGTTEEQLHYAKKLYDSAFHPDTGDRMNLIGRMSFQVPGGMAITGFMLQFYRSALFK